MASEDTTTAVLNPQKIGETYDRIKPYVHKTPLLTCRSIDKEASSAIEGQPAPNFRIFFKCENFQKMGAFKARGAFHAIIGLIDTVGLDELKRRGVVTHSSGESNWVNRPQLLSDAESMDILGYSVGLGGEALTAE